jgi:hypothetical protein
MVSMRSSHTFREGDTVYDARNDRTGIVTHRPEPGAWICLADPDHPDDYQSRWHALFGDLRPVDGKPAT